MKKENAQQGAQSVSVSESEYSTIHPVANTCEPVAMSSIEIAELTGKRHDHVIRDTELMFSELELDAPKFGAVYQGGNGQARKCYSLPKDLALTLASGYNIKLRYAIIKRLDELERASQPHLPRTRTEAIEMMLEQSRMLDHQQAYIEETKDDVEFAHAVSSSKSGVNIEVFAKSVGIGRNKLFAWLRKEKILMSDPIPKYSKSHNMPYQHFIDAKYFTVKRRAFNTYHGRERGFTPLITGKGEVWLTRKLIKAGLTDSTANTYPALPHQQ